MRTPMPMRVLAAGLFRKRKLLWMQNGGEKGIEIDDVRAGESAARP